MQPILVFIFDKKRLFIHGQSAKEVKKKLQTNAKKGFWSTNADLDFVGRGGHYFFAYCTTFVDFLCGTV